MAETLRLPVEIVDKYSGQLRAFQDALKQVKQPDSVNHLNHSFDRMTSGARKAREVIGEGLRSAMMGFGVGALSISGGIAAIAASSLSLGTSVAGLKRLSDETGASVNNLDLLSKAALRFGVSADAVGPGVKKLAEGIRDAKLGLGGSLYDLQNIPRGAELYAKLRASRSTDDATKIALDAIAKEKDGFTKERLADVLFGDKSMAGFGRLGKADMDRRIAETEGNRRPLNEQQIANAEALEKSIISVKESFQSLKDSLGSALMPTVAELSEKFSKFINDNREWLEGKFKEAVKTTMEFFEKVDWKAIGEGLLKFGQAVAEAIKFITGLVSGSDTQKQIDDQKSGLDPAEKDRIEKENPGGRWRMSTSDRLFYEYQKHWYSGYEQVYPKSGAKTAPPMEGDKSSEDRPKSGLIHKSSFGGVTDFGGMAGASSSESTAQRIIRQGVFEALLMFKQWVEGAASRSSGGFGGGGGVQNASYSPGDGGGFGGFGGGRSRSGSGTSFGNEGAPVTGRTTARGNLAKNQQEAYNTARQEGLSHEDAKTLVGNMSGESLANPGDHHWDAKHMSQGIVQWDPQRSAAIKKQFGKEPRFMSVAEQTRAALWEMKTKYKKTWEALNNPNLSHQQKMNVIVRDYERPANPGAAVNQRMQFRNGLKLNEQQLAETREEAARAAREAAEKKRQNEAQIRRDAPAKSTSPTGANMIKASMGGDGDGPGRGSLDIKLHGFPKGTSTKSDMGGLFRDVDITKARPMVPAAMDI